MRLAPLSLDPKPLAFTLNPYHQPPSTRWLSMRVVAATPPRERNKVKLLALLVSSAGRQLEEGQRRSKTI